MYSRGILIKPLAIITENFKLVIEQVLLSSYRIVILILNSFALRHSFLRLSGLHSSTKETVVFLINHFNRWFLMLNRSLKFHFRVIHHIREVAKPLRSLINMIHRAHFSSWWNQRRLRFVLDKRWGIRELICWRLRVLETSAICNRLVLVILREAHICWGNCIASSLAYQRVFLEFIVALLKWNY